MSAQHFKLRPGRSLDQRAVAGGLFFLFVLFLAPIAQVATASPAETCIQQNEACTSWDPASGPVETEVHIRGWNWSTSSAGSTSQITWRFAPEKVVGTITISGDGTFSETIKVPDDAPAGETTIDVDGDFTLGRPLHFEVTRSSGHSAELDGPSFIYPKNGQTLDYEGAYLFKVKPVPGASGYLWGFFQGGKMVWENYRNERKLSGTEYGIQPGTPAHKKFVKGTVAIWVRGLVNGKWTKATIITIHLQPKAAPPARTHTPAAPTPTPVPKPQDTYVALGDSFSSGEGAIYGQSGDKIRGADYEPGTDDDFPLIRIPLKRRNVCHRAEQAYPYLVQQQLGQNFSLELRACSGAEIKDYFHANNRSANNPEEPAQEEAFEDNKDKDNTKLVTLTFGGNDIGFATLLGECMTNIPQGGKGLYFDILAECGGEIERAMTNVPKIVHTHDQLVKPFKHRRLAEKPKDKGLSELYTQLLSDAPQARIMVLGYPRLYDPVQGPKPVHTPVPAPGATPNPYLDDEECSTSITLAGHPVDTYLHSRDEQKKANAVVDELNSTISETVSHVNLKQNTDRLVYVNVSHAFKNGGICESEGKRLVNLFIPDGRLSPNQSFHPNDKGQEALADRVVKCYSDRSLCGKQ
jgi:lysophospholipase L1-like esterase